MTLFLLRYAGILLFVAFIAYVVLIVVPYLRRRKDRPGDAQGFEWHFFVPCRDEAAVIGATIHRLTTSFPGANVWVIDDDSEDSTARLVQSASQANPLVQLVQRRLPEARTGKGDALNSAYTQMSASLPPGTDRDRVIVCVVDADGELDPDALRIVAGPDGFGDPTVGAVQVTVTMRNRADRQPFGPGHGKLAQWFGRYMVRMQDIEFRTVIAAMQSLRSRTESVGLGGNGQFTRLTVLDSIAREVGEPWHGALLEDYELGLHVLFAGYRNKYLHDTYVSQEAVPHFRRLVTQRARWAQGNIQCMKYFPRLIRSPRISNAGLVESTYYLCLPYVQMAGLLVFGSLFFYGIWAFATGHVYVELYEQYWYIPVGLFAVSVAPFAMWAPIYKLYCEPSATWWQAVFWAIGLWVYVYYCYLCIPLAFSRVIRGQNGWAKTRRNAEVITHGPIAIEK